jgi:hypothetical protein
VTGLALTPCQFLKLDALIAVQLFTGRGDEKDAQPISDCAPRAYKSLEPISKLFVAQVRSVASSSASAHLITSSSFSPPCVNLDTMTVLIAWL